MILSLVLVLIVFFSNQNYGKREGERKRTHEFFVHECPITVCMCKLLCSGNYSVSTLDIHLENRMSSRSRRREERREEKAKDLIF